MARLTREIIPIPAIVLGGARCKLMLITLSELSKENFAGEFECWPTVRELASFDACNLATARNHIRRLERRGFITVLSDRPRPNLYRLNRAAILEAAKQASQTKPKGPPQHAKNKVASLPYS